MYKLQFTSIKRGGRMTDASLFKVFKADQVG
jgi:hypothetical protein